MRAPTTLDECPSLSVQLNSSHIVCDSHRQATQAQDPEDDAERQRSAALKVRRSGAKMEGQDDGARNDGQVDGETQP